MLGNNHFACATFPINISKSSVMYSSTQILSYILSSQEQEIHPILAEFSRKDVVNLQALDPRFATLSI